MHYYLTVGHILLDKLEFIYDLGIEILFVSFRFYYLYGNG